MIDFYLNVARIKDKNSFFMYSMMTVSKTIYDLPENLFPPILRVSGENTWPQEQVRLEAATYRWGAKGKKNSVMSILSLWPDRPQKLNLH